ncbi:MAG: ABC transporter substrate-binding protein [Chloroflexi bacterium]|nr:ABC transporter substrate-binding protein [Chloroflexota bacterium]
MVNTGNYWTRQRVSRRTALRGAGVGVAGLAGAALIGCGGGDDEADPTAAPTAAGTAAATATQVRDTTTPESASIKRGGTWSVANVGDPPTLYPYGNLSFETKGIGTYVYQRLFKRETFAGSDGGQTLPGPDLAISAETDDGSVWTLKLRDQKFQNVAPVDGRKITSEDVLFSIGLLKAPETPNASEVDNWVKVEAPDDSTVVFTLDAPSPTFLEQISDTNLLQILPIEADGGFDPAVSMIGGGPWIMNEYQPSVGFEFDANPDYYEIGEDGKPLPYTDHLSRPIIPEYSNRLAQFLAGNITGLAINANDVLDLRASDPDLQWLGQVSQLMSIFYWSNPQTTTEAWGDDRFRKAVSMSLDRDGLTDLGYNAFALRDAGLPANLAWNNFIPAGWGDRWWLDPQSAAHGDSGKFFNYDIAESKKMLAAMGLEDGFSIPYIYTGRYGGAFPPIAEAHINMMEQIGLAPQTDVQDYSSTYITQTFRGEFEGMAFGYETPFPEAGSYFKRMFGEDSANHSNISDPTMDGLSAAQAVELDEEKRRAIMHEAQILNAENMWYAPSQAGAGTSYTAYQKHVQGGIRDTMGYGAGTEEYIWYWLDV